jgi:hypothetical protein
MMRRLEGGPHGRTGIEAKAPIVGRALSDCIVHAATTGAPSDGQRFGSEDLKYGLRLDQQRPTRSAQCGPDLLVLSSPPA